MSTINLALTERSSSGGGGGCGGGCGGAVLNNSLTATKVPYLEPRFECPICLSCLKEPVLTYCGHRFCHICIHSWFKKTGMNCPIDGLLLSPEKDLFPDNFTRREIDQQETECPFTDCSNKRIPLLDIENHIDLFHKNNNTSTQGVCRGVVTATRQESGDKRCERSDTMRQTPVADAKAEEADMWTPPSKNADQPPSGQTLIKKMYERIVLLEQSNHELEIKLNNAKSKMESMALENSALKSDLSLRMCQGVYIWRIPNFTAKISKMTKDASVMYYSQGFYTSFSGYRFCGRVNICAGDVKWLSVFVHVMCGDNDDALSWPFSGRLAVTLVNPRKGAKSQTEISSPPAGLEAFNRPIGTMNMRAFGYLHFATVHELHTDGYLDNRDTLVIKFEITSV